MSFFDLVHKKMILIICSLIKLIWFSSSNSIVVVVKSSHEGNFQKLCFLQKAIVHLQNWNIVRMLYAPLLWYFYDDILKHHLLSLQLYKQEWQETIFGEKIMTFFFLDHPPYEQGIWLVKPFSEQWKKLRVQPVTQGRRISQLTCSGDSGPSHLGIYLSSIRLCK